MNGFEQYTVAFLNKTQAGHILLKKSRNIWIYTNIMVYVVNFTVACKYIKGISNQV